MDRRRPERNQIPIAAHKADLSAVLHDWNDVAGEQCASAVRAGGQCKTVAALKMTTQLIRSAYPKVKVL